MLITKIILETAYLHIVKEFYSSILELQVDTIDERTIAIAIGNTELIFKEAARLEPFYHLAINIPANKIEEAKAWLSGKVSLIWLDDYNSEIADFSSWHAKSVYFYDPAGNILELIARFDLKNATEKTFSADQFLSVSEAGIVFPADEFDKKVEGLMQQFQIYYFNKQSPMPQFRAIGDDEGLFIVVPEKRNWFPTQKPSGIFPMEIKFRNQGKSYLMKL